MNLDQSLQLENGVSCAVVGGSSLTTLSAEGEVRKHNFYPTTVEEYFGNIAEAVCTYGKLDKAKTDNIVCIAAPGAFQNEGATAALPPNFHRVQADAEQRGMPYLPFRDLLQNSLQKLGYQANVYGYNDTVPALLGTLSQSNTAQILQDFESKLSQKNKSQYAIKYLINGTGTGEASLYPDNKHIISAEKGHLIPSLIWYQLNPFFKFITKYPVVGANRSIERLIAGGPSLRAPRHFCKILRCILEVLQKDEHSDHNILAQLLGFRNIDDLRKADGQEGLLQVNLLDETFPLLPRLGEESRRGNAFAQAIRDIFARAVGTSFAYMHYATGLMPDSPLHTFIGVGEVRASALGFIRSDGSTTALFGQDGVAWTILNQSAQQCANAIWGINNQLNLEPPIFEVKNINRVFPDIQPDFGGLATLANNKKLS